MLADGARPSCASRANETTHETADESGRLTLASSTANISLGLTRGEPAHHSRSHRIDPVGDNQAMPRDGITMSDRGGSRRTRAVPPDLRACEIEFCDVGGRPYADDLHGVEAVDDVGFSPCWAAESPGSARTRHVPGLLWRLIIGKWHRRLHCVPSRRLCVPSRRLYVTSP